MTIPLDASLSEQIAYAMAAVRSKPESPSARLALVQLDCIRGNWSRARRQLDVLAQLDPDAQRFVDLHLSLIDAELHRESVFAGNAQPVIMGPPPEWIAMLVHALQSSADIAAALRRQAADAAPDMQGSADDSKFTWIQDADLRLGPVLEVVASGQLFWLPFLHLRRLTANPPATPCDLVWQPVRLLLAEGPEIEAFVPTRYPGLTEEAADALCLARMTDWSGPQDCQIGHGQRMFTTEAADLPFLDIRRLTLAPSHMVGANA